MSEPLVGGWAVVMACWFLFSVGACYDARTREDGRRWARYALAAPLWPVLLIVVLGRGLGWLINEARS